MMKCARCDKYHYGDMLRGNDGHLYCSISCAQNKGNRTVQVVVTTSTCVDQSKSLFIKHDKQKSRPSLIDPDYINGLAEVLTYGANKYSINNWKKCEDISRYKDALLRHILAYLSGEEKDAESGLSHLHHASANLMFLNYFENNAIKCQKENSIKS